MAAERVAAILDDEGGVENLVVLPADDEQLGDGWRAQLPRLRVLTDEERKRGVAPGWRRAGNGRWVDERPQPAPPATAPAAASPAPTTPAAGGDRAAPR